MSHIMVPMVVMVFWSILVLVYGAGLRYQAILTKQVKMNYFKIFSGETPPERMVQAGNHIRNLYEVPVLFYAACLSVVALELDIPSFATLAWVFVIARLCHGVIHMTYNHVAHRLVAFVVSVGCVAAQWILIALNLS